jgi:hypothetical protein
MLISHKNEVQVLTKGQSIPLGTKKSVLLYMPIYSIEMSYASYFKPGVSHRGFIDSPQYIPCGILLA